MRVRIVFTVKNRGGYVPFHHQHLLAQTIKGILASSGNALLASRTDYNFSGLKGQIKISRKGLHFYSTKATLVFSTGDKDFLEAFKALLFAFKELVVGNLALIPDALEQEETVEFSDSCKFLCISPIVLIPGGFNDEKSKRFVPPEGDEFSDLLYECTMQRMAASGRFSDAALASFYKFQVVPDKNYLLRIAEGHKKFARIYPLFDLDIKYEVRGYTFPFTLFAPKEVLRFVYENGLGYFSHKGFGMVDLGKSHGQAQTLEEEAVFV